MRHSAVPGLALSAMLAGGAVQAQTTRLVTEEATVASPQPGLQIYVRNKHPADVAEFGPDRTLVFLPGAIWHPST